MKSDRRGDEVSLQCPEKIADDNILCNVERGDGCQNCHISKSPFETAGFECVKMHKISESCAAYAVVVRSSRE